MSRPALLFVLIILSASGFCQSQSRQSAVHNYISDHHIDTAFIFSRYCAGTIRFLRKTDSCQAAEYTQYLFWKQNGKHSVKRFERCENDKVVELPDNNPLSFYLTHHSIIDTEKIKPPTFSIRTIKGADGRDSLIVTSIAMTAHSCFPTFEFILNKSSVKKQTDEYDLDFPMFNEEGEKNFYYEY